jgi:hypothetical protein
MQMIQVSKNIGLEGRQATDTTSESELALGTLDHERPQGNRKLNIPSRGDSGFALVIALMLMGFILVLLLTVSTLVRVESINSFNQSKQLESRLNALLGLQIAIGQLQKLHGADQTVSATGDLLSSSGYSGSEAVLTAKQWTGIWDSRLPQSTGFLGWLVSAPAGSAVDTEGFATSNVSGDTVELLGNGTLGSSTKAADLKVIVPTVSILNSQETEVGEFAFWVGDEGVKAKFQGTLPSSTESTDQRHRDDFRLNQRNAIETYGDLSQTSVGEILTAAMTNQPRTFTREQLLLADTPITPALLGESYFDYSAYSMGLLTDTKNGGWRRDLTWLFETANVASELTTIDADTSIPGSQINATWPSSSTQTHWSPAPTWELLRDYYRLSLGTAPPYSARRQSATIHGITPTITHFIINFIPGLNGQISDNGSAADPSDDFFQGKLRIYLDVKLTLWNPYDTAITLPSSDLEILWRTDSDGISPDMEMRFGDNNGTYTKHSGTLLDSFFGESGAGFFPFTDTFYGNNNCTGLSFRIPETTLQAGEIVMFMIADNEDGASYSGQNNLASIQSIGLSNTVWLEHSDTIDSGTAPLSGEDVAQQAFTFAKLDLNQAGPIIHHLAIKKEGTAGNDSPADFDEYYGRYLAEKTSAPTFGQTINQDDPNLAEAVFGNPLLVTNMSLALPSIQVSHWLQQYIHMHSSNSGFRDSRWAINYNPRAPTMRPTEAEIAFANNPLTNGNLLSTTTPYAGPFLNTVQAGSNVLAADRPTYGDSYAEHRVVIYSLPRQGFKPLSIGDLQHVDAHPQSASNNYLISNSLVDMRMTDTNQLVRLPNDQDTYAPNIDGSYLLNESLWDHYFFSTIDGSLTQTDLNAGKKFANSRIQLAEAGTLDDFETALARFDRGAARLQVDGMFNINSTSKEAWKAVLASSNDLAYDPVNGSITAGQLKTSFSRLLRPTTGNSTREDSWLNYRTLNDTELENLALNIVNQIRLRGPFRSLSDFVNRRIGEPASGTGLRGPLAEAIDQAGINKGSNQLDLPPNEILSGVYSQYVADWYIEEAVVGSRSAGATRWLTQGDLLQRIGGMLSARSDTFIIRSYGKASGMVTGKDTEAYLEAVVQRKAEAVSPTGTDSFTPSDAFGRRFEIVDLRWVQKNDI